MARTKRTRGQARRRARRILALLPKPRAGRRLTPGIVRVDSNRTHGYVVRIGYVRGPNGWRARYRAYFGDRMYGGKRRALAAAERWIRELVRTGKPPRKK
jgi:hypothetical protein